MSQKHLLYIAAILLAASAAIISLFSACSPLYPLNPWDDANIFMTIGQALHRGSRLYTDVFDHKGPLLYLLHQWSAAWFARPFAGIYILEILCLWGYLLFAWLTTQLWDNNRIALPFIILLGMCYVASDFYYYGDTAEELCLPWIMMMLYYLLRYARCRLTPSPWAATAIGLGIGVIFWIKFTVLSPYVGAILALFIICWRRKTWSHFWYMAGYAALGFALLSAGILTYYIARGELADVIDGYFGFNLFKYHGLGEKSDDSMHLYPLRLLVWVALSAIPWLRRRVDTDIRLMVTMAFAATLLLFAITTVYIYYFIICFAFFPLLYCFVRQHDLTWRTACIAGCLGILIALTNFNLTQLCRGTFPRAILTVVDQLAEQNTDRGVLTYRSKETAYYTYANQQPPIRFFFMPSIMHQDMKDEQDACLQSRQCRYLLVKDRRFPEEEYAPIPANGYQLIAERRELFRTLKLLNPTLYLWNLGWPQPVMRLILQQEPTPQEAVFRLYERY